MGGIAWAARVRDGLTAARALASEAELKAWAARANVEIVPRVVLADEAPSFLNWARTDPWWALVIAECATLVCAKPPEAAAFILVEGWRQQLVDEGRLPDDDT
ncbi:MAG: hypothetical protein AAGN82_04565 [Myxococcota bacterium]